MAAVGISEAEHVAEHGTRTSGRTEGGRPEGAVLGDARGQLQVGTHHGTDGVVSVHAVTPRTADTIPEATLAVTFGLTVDDGRDTVHPFPTFGEAFEHAGQAVGRDSTTRSCCVE